MSCGRTGRNTQLRWVFVVPPLCAPICRPDQANRVAAGTSASVSALSAPQTVNSFSSVCAAPAFNTAWVRPSSCLKRASPVRLAAEVANENEDEDENENEDENEDQGEDERGDGGKQGNRQDVCWYWSRPSCPGSDHHSDSSAPPAHSRSHSMSS